MFKNMTFRIRPSIFFVVMTMILFSVSVVLTMQYFSSVKLATTATKESIGHISQKTEIKLINMSDKSKDFISIIEATTGTMQQPSPDIQHELQDVFTTIMSSNDFIYAMYIGYANDDFYEIIHINESLQKK